MIMNNLFIIAGVFVGFMLLRRTQVKDGGGTPTPTPAPERGARRVPTLNERIYNRWGTMAERVSSEGGSVVPTTLILAVIRQESAGDPNAVGSIGEVGLMQMTHAAWWDATGQVEPSADPLSNMLAGATYLMHCNVSMGYTRDDPHWLHALRAYNAGPTRAFAEPSAGKTYAESVMSYRQAFEEIA